MIKIRSVGKGVAWGASSSPLCSPFPGSKMFFTSKIGNHKTFTCEEHMKLELIY